MNKRDRICEFIGAETPGQAGDRIPVESVALAMTQANLDGIQDEIRARGGSPLP